MSANHLVPDRTDFYSVYLAQEVGFDADRLAFLDRGIENSPFQTEIPTYADRLAASVPPLDLPLGMMSARPLDPLPPGQWHPYPDRGQLPILQEDSLDFLHPDIQHACLCIGLWRQQTFHTQWWGRQALLPVEFWSATKIIPLLYLVAQLPALIAMEDPQTIDLDRYRIRDHGSDQCYRFSELATEVISYQQRIATSNAIAHSFKLLATPIALETWLKQLTGNLDLKFQGRYGEPPFLKQPELYDPDRDRVLLSAQVDEHRGDNTVSAYDLTRVLSSIGWHAYLPMTAQISGVSQQSLKPLITALGTDSARYLDVAIRTLELEPYLHFPVILSKMGFGRSHLRDRSELSYVVLGQWLNTRYKPAQLQTFCLTLLAAQTGSDPHEEARRLDARMATEVTKILDRLQLLPDLLNT